MSENLHPVLKSRSLLFSLIAASLFWILFYPGLLSLDSAYIVHHAMTDYYEDLHPPLMTIVINSILKLGGGIHHIILGQLILGFLGIRRLILALIRSITGPPALDSELVVLGILALLASPLTPLSIYLATLWTDTWLAILLLWSMAFLLEVNGDSTPLNGRTSIFKVVLALLLASLVILVRYNAIIAYLSLAVVIFHVLRNRSIGLTRSILAVLCPPAASLLFMFVSANMLDIQRTHPENAVYALDLASMIDHDPTICNNLGITSCELASVVFPPGISPGRGAIDFTLNQNRTIVYEPFLKLFLYHGLKDEFVMAAIDHPFLLLKIKALNYLDYTFSSTSQFFYPGEMPVTRFDMPFARRFVRQSAIWFSMTDWVIRNPILRWFSFVHVPWLTINLLSLILCFYMSVREIRFKFLGMLLLVPALYYFSFFAALTASEFRFMYPSMLLVQVITLAVLASWSANRWLVRTSEPRATASLPPSAAPPIAGRPATRLRKS